MIPASKAKVGKKRARKKRAHSTTAEFDRLLRSAEKRERYILRLYITGSSPRSTQAITNIRNLCEERLAGRYDLEVIDIYQQPSEAAGNQIIAAPTLVKERPVPLKRMVGDLSNRERVLIGLDLDGKKTAWVHV